MKSTVVVLMSLVMLSFAACGTQAEVYKTLQANWTGAQNEEAEVTHGTPQHFDISTDHNIVARVRAEVDPWINADMSFTEMKWFIHAPQTYLAQFFKLTVHTNSTNGFQLTIKGSTGLQSAAGSSLDTWYALVTERQGEGNRSHVVPSEFLKGGNEFNKYSYGYDDGPVVMNFYLWNKVQVDTLSPAEEYTDEFTVTVSCGM